MGGVRAERYACFGLVLPDTGHEVRGYDLSASKASSVALVVIPCHNRSTR